MPTASACTFSNLVRPAREQRLVRRKGAAIAQVRPGEVPWANIFAGVKWFHVTGITPALSPSAADATREAILAARNAGVRVSIDLNYRAKLWTPAEAGKWMNELLPTATS